MRIDDIVKAVNGTIVGASSELEITGVSTDSRQQLDNKLFIALKGESFDGHDYVEKALANGAVCALCEREILLDKPVIVVESTHQALRDLAEYYRSLFKIPVVAVTGSAGKTTTKDMIASVLSQKYKVLKTEKNFNNEIGVPLTVFQMDSSDELAVFEMGMNHFGEIHNLSKIVKPNICVITNIGVSHIENLGSREGILKAKSEIFDFMPEDGVKILSGDDDMLRSIVGNTIFYGVESNNDIYAESIEYHGVEGISADICCGEQKFKVHIPQPGLHMVHNALAAAAVGFKLGLTADEIRNGIESFTPPKMRMNILNPANGLIIVDDTYNANPASTKAAIDVLAYAKGRKVCILGDMLELGSFSEEMHYSIGQYVAESKIDVIICVGDLGKAIYKGAVEYANGIQVMHYANQDLLAAELEKILCCEDTVLVKASRGMKLEKTVARLTELKPESFKQNSR